MAKAASLTQSRVRLPDWNHHRYDFEGQGRTVVLILTLVFVALAFTYHLAHQALPPASTAPKPEKLVQVSRIGVVTIVSPEDIDWYVGDKAKPILAAVNQHNQEIATIYARIRELTGRLSGNASPEANAAAAKLLASLYCADNGTPLPPPPRVRLPNLRELQGELHQLTALVTAVRSQDLLGRAWIDELDRQIRRVAEVAGWRAETGTYSEKTLKELRDSIEELRRTFAGRPVSAEASGGTAAPAATPPTDARDLALQLAKHTANIDAWLERQGDPMGAFDQYAFTGVSEPTGSATAALLDELRIHVSRLLALHHEQRDAVESLEPPVKLTFFWMSPGGLLAEVLFWGACGILTNLMLNVAESVRRGNYSPREFTVILTKLFYGPIISLILCLTILTGLMNLGGYEIRAWSLPLLGFFFGFNARKSAALIDRLSSKIFGAAKKSIDQGPQAIAQARQATLQRYLDLVKPVTLTELRDVAKRVASDTVEHIVQHNEALR